jgi:hypothetical protein
MAYSATIVIANRTEAELTVFVEPGTQVFRLAAGGKVRIHADADYAGDFEIDHSGEYMTVSGWATATLRCEVEGADLLPASAELPGEVVARAVPGQRAPTHVSLILVGDNEVKVEAGADVDPKALRALGGHRSLLSRGTWTFPARDEQALGTLLHELRELGVAFAWQPSGWPPAAVFAHLRDRGMVEGPIKAITWRAPGDFQLFEF